jgi:ABC-2 type transport system ATP-binding protein
MEEQPPALRMTGLHKAFRDTVAVDQVDLTVLPGLFFGLVGPNGAGKTTALSMATGLLRPDAGRCEVLGVDVWANPVRARQLMGVPPDGLAVPERLAGRELLTLIGQLRGMDPDVIAQRTQNLLDVMGLIGAERTLIVDYSIGMRKKVGLATAVLHAPQLTP